MKREQRGSNMGKGSRFSTLLLGVLASIMCIPTASAANVSNSSSFTLALMTPLLLALFIAYFVRRWFIPQQLKNLQVAFEIDDDLYEVHRITRTLRDARKLLRYGSVGYGVLLYMMGLTGVLVLIMELLFILLSKDLQLTFLALNQWMSSLKSMESTLKLLVEFMNFWKLPRISL